MLGFETPFCLAILWHLANAQHAPQIDQEPFISVFNNSRTVPYNVCVEHNTDGWGIYTFEDIQTRIAAFIIPLFILMGSFQFAQIGNWNFVLVTFHSMADPWTSIYNLLSKLAAYRDIRRRCQFGDSATQRAMSIILASYDDWWPCLEMASGNENRQEDLLKSKIASFIYLLSDSRFPTLQMERVNEIRAAARELSDARLNSVGKVLLGTVNYGIAVFLALVNISKGKLNNRYGHSLAFSILWTWLLVIVFLSTMTGGFATKRSVRSTLTRLDRHLDAISANQARLLSNPSEGAEADFHRRPSLQMLSVPFEDTIRDSSTQLNGSGLHHEPIFRFGKVSDFGTEDLHYTLSWIGMNYSLNPSSNCPNHLKTKLVVASFLPILVACVAANWLSITNPTYGFGCRNIEQCGFVVSWIISATASWYIRNHHPASARSLTHGKDVIFGLALAIIFLMGFIGWFNRCWCWAAVASNGKDSYIVMNPIAIDHMMALAKVTWKVISFPTLGFQLLFVEIVAVVFWDGVTLFNISDEEHEGLFARANDGVRERQPSEGDMGREMERGARRAGLGGRNQRGGYERVQREERPLRDRFESSSSRRPEAGPSTHDLSEYEMMEWS